MRDVKRTASLLIGSAFFIAIQSAGVAAAEAAAPPGLAGVWDGQIAGQPVRACFNVREFDAYGIYYYRKQLEAIPLQPAGDKGNIFVEGADADDAKAARWTISGASGDLLSGDWTQGARKFPLRLNRVRAPKPSEDESWCGSMLFQQPRLAGVTILTKPVAKNGLSYTKLVLDTRGRFGENVSVESFALAGDGAATKRINARLRLPFSQTGDESWLTCIRMGADSTPLGADIAESFEPRLVTAKWLSVMHHWDGYCGGAHPDSVNTPMLFDRTTGAEVRLLDWFGDRAVKREQVEGSSDVLISLRPAFRSFLLRGWKAEDQECGDAVREEEYWDVELTHTGFTFTPQLPHAVMACSEDFKLSFAAAAPYLSPDGKRQLAALSASAKK